MSLPTQAMIGRPRHVDCRPVLPEETGQFERDTQIQFAFSHAGRDSPRSAV